MSKVETSLQELEETIYWLELLIEGGIMDSTRLESLCAESQELVAILVASVKTAKKRLHEKR